MEQYKDLIEKHRGKVASYLTNVGETWLNEHSSQTKNQKDAKDVCWRYILSVNELGSSHRVIIWYGNAEYTPSYAMDFSAEDNAYFQSVAVKGYCISITVTIQNNQTSQFYVIINDMLGTLLRKKLQINEFQEISDAEKWIKKSIQ